MCIEVEYRKADPQDASILTDIARQSYSLYIDRMGKEPAPMTADYQILIENDEVWVALHQDKIVGFSVVINQYLGIGNDAFPLLETIAIASQHQGKGLGTKLLEFTEQQIALNNFEGVKLYTNIKMTENLVWYPKLGYQNIGTFIEDGFERVYFEKIFS